MIETGFQKLQILSIVVKFSLIFFYFFLFEQGDIKTLLWNTFGLKKKNSMAKYFQQKNDSIQLTMKAECKACHTVKGYGLTLFKTFLDYMDSK